MLLSDEQTFVENPITAFIIPSVINWAVFAFIAVLYLSIGEISPTGNSAGQGIKTVNEAITSLFFFFLFVNLMIFLIFNFFRKQTILCNGDGFLILTKRFWDSSEKENRFLWSEVTEFNVKSGYRGAKSFVVFVKGEEMVLMNRTISNFKSFDNLVLLFKKSTPHLQRN